MTPVPVETIRAGDKILVHPHVPVRTVLRVNRYPTIGMEPIECFVISYEAREAAACWENRAGRKGVGTWHREEGQLKPLRRGELVELVARSAELQRLDEPDGLQQFGDLLVDDGVGRDYPEAGAAGGEELVTDVPGRDRGDEEGRLGESASPGDEHVAEAGHPPTLRVLPGGQVAATLNPGGTA